MQFDATDYLHKQELYISNFLCHNITQGRLSVPKKRKFVSRMTSFFSEWVDTVICHYDEYDVNRASISSLLFVGCHSYWGLRREKPGLNIVSISIRNSIAR